MVYGYAHFGLYEQDPEHPVEGDEWVMLDRITHGLHKNKFMGIFARPKVGKTRFVAGLLPNMAEQVPDGEVIRVFTFETTTQQWMQTSAATLAGIPDPSMADTGHLTDEQYSRYIDAIDYIDKLPIRYYDKPMSFGEISRLVRSKKRPTFLWILDHFGLVTDSGIDSDGYGGVRALSRNISYLCHDVCTGIVVSHLTRVSVGNEPSLESVAHSDNISRDLDQAWFIHRIWDGHERPAGLLDDGEPVMLKVESRFSRGGIIWVWWDKLRGQFRELSKEEMQELGQFKPPKKQGRR